MYELYISEGLGIYSFQASLVLCALVCISSLSLSSTKLNHLNLLDISNMMYNFVFGFTGNFFFDTHTWNII